MLTKSKDTVSPTDPLLSHHPIVQTITCSTQELAECRVPAALTSTILDLFAHPPEEVQESIYEIVEYLDMVALGSPRIQTTDRIDPFLSRYAVPHPSENADTLWTLTWTGLIDSRWVLEMVCSIM